MSCPPFKITPDIVIKVQAISRELGSISGQKMAPIPLKNIPTATGSRDLLEGIQLKILTRQGEKNKKIYKFC